MSPGKDSVSERSPSYITSKAVNFGDLGLLPILTLLYLLSFIDRSNIANAKLESLTTQLHLTGNRYNIALSMYFVPYCVCECLSNLFLKKFRPSRWLPGITLVWGLVMASMGLVKNYHELVAVRAMLGGVEAGLFPGVVY
jgi:sugar phosphate permease